MGGCVGVSEGTAREVLTAAASPKDVGLESEGIRLTPGLRWRVVQVFLDLATVFAAATLAYTFYLSIEVGRQHYAPDLYLKLHLLIAAVTVSALQAHGAYSSQMGLLRIDDVRRVLRASAAGLLLVLVVSFCFKLPTFSRITGVMFWPVITFALVGQRILFGGLRRKLSLLQPTSKPVLIYGAGETGQLLARCLREESHLGLEPVGFLDDDESLRHEERKIEPGVGGKQLRVLGTGHDMDRVLRNLGVKVVFLAMPSASSRRIGEMVADLENRGLKYFFVPSAGDMLFSGLQFGQVAGVPVFTRRRPAADRAYAAIRRSLDIVVAGGILLLSLPLLAVSALLVKLTSPGPVLFSQQRIGKGGRPFSIHKIRTMHADAPKYAVHPQAASDARMFPVGRWLRRLSIDELPQLWNVLKGEMSLVGPRPEMPFIVERYNEAQRQRLTVTPGVTGLWQISADRAFCIHENMYYDLYYVENRSLSLDFAILLMTPFVLLARNRAK
jgi:exopolysaccharide biosynthesis polyprenyl glycosylphosphotransferase